MRTLRFRILTAWRRRRREGRRWMEGWPRLTGWLVNMGCLDRDASAIARGVSIGLLIGLTPTVGFQITMMIAACLLFRGNFLAAFAVSWVSNPITMGPLYYGFHAIGELLFAPFLMSLAQLSGLYGDLFEEYLITFLGSLVVAIPAAIGGYFLSLKEADRRRGTGVRLRPAIREASAAIRGGAAMPSVTPGAARRP